ncbi:MAG: hypothetical protein IPH60_14880 [Flavobacteriales bacterium]|nr:hypothetical protein [Flavobacteriales bacterium]
MREEQRAIGTETGGRVDQIRETVMSSQELIARKFDEFTSLMEKSNTEALVKAIENVIGGFNDKLTELIDRLVRENFEELNRSVKSLNDWQRENRNRSPRSSHSSRMYRSDFRCPLKPSAPSPPLRTSW